MSEMHPEKRPPTAEYCEQLILRYIRALDSSDTDDLDFVLEAAEDDPELDQLISEVNQTMHDDLGLGPLVAESTVVHDLLRQYIPSAFAQPSLELLPLTVGDVATRMLNDCCLSPVDREGCRSLLGNPEPAPDRPSRQAVADLAARLEPANPLTERGWTFFRDAAIMTLMGRGRQQAHVAAARAYRDAGPAIDRAAPGTTPLNDLIGAHPIRLAEIAGLNYYPAAEYLAAETDQTIDILADQTGDLAGFLYCQLHNGILIRLSPDEAR
jgi:hypothetical protein